MQISLLNPLKGLKRRLVAESSTETFGIRGAGATASSQVAFGQPISLQDLVFAVRREPVANRVDFQVAHDIFDKWFKVEEAAEKPDPDLDKLVQLALSDLNAKDVFTQMAVFERLAGWAIIIVGYVDYGKTLRDPVDHPVEIQELAAYMGESQVTVQATDVDYNISSRRFGLPIYYTVNRGIGASKEKVHYSRVIHFATRLLIHPFQGLSVLEPIYDDITVLRNIRCGLGKTLHRYGSGFPDITAKSATKKQLDDLEASQQFRNLRTGTYFLHDDKTTIEFKGLQGRALNPEPYYVPIMENISAGTGVPMAMLRGVQAGALTGSEVNQQEYFKMISDAQSRYEPGIRQLINVLLRIGQIPAEIGDYKIEWLGGFEVNEKDKAHTELMLAQAREKKLAWMTINEVRAEQDLEPIEGGDIIPSLAHAQEAPPFSQFSNLRRQTEK